jgi:hypothetical protein
MLFRATRSVLTVTPGGAAEALRARYRTLRADDHQDPRRGTETRAMARGCGCLRAREASSSAGTTAPVPRLRPDFSCVAAPAVSDRLLLNRLAQLKGEVRQAARKPVGMPRVRGSRTAPTAAFLSVFFLAYGWHRAVAELRLVALCGVDFPCNRRPRTLPDGVLRARYVRSVNDVIDVNHLSRTPDHRKGPRRV